VAEAVVLDAFAGSGALGIEALSRGAAQVTFADTDPSARATVEANLASTDLAGQARVIATDGHRALGAGGPWNLVLLDPPYEHDGWPTLLDAVTAHLAEDGVVVIESDREIPLPAALDAIRVKRYGGTVVTIASPRRSTS
jgi:16S rRNA (guanine966-N2)-methyltransferase